MAKKQTSDDELNLRRKARRRLIGAIALTLAVVVVLPMVLDSTPKPVQPDIDLRIPDPEKIGEFVPSKAIPAKSTLPPVADKSATTEATASSNNKDTSAKKAKASDKLAKPKLSSPKATAKKAVSNASGERYVAQIGAYSNADAAKKELAKLKKWGFVRAHTEKAGDTIRVRVGPYVERSKVEMVGKMLEGHGLKPVILTTK
ncbi:MAG: SPOR domain-containing protein [Gallionella sp.]